MELLRSWAAIEGLPGEEQELAQSVGLGVQRAARKIPPLHSSAKQSTTF